MFFSENSRIRIVNCLYIVFQHSVDFCLLGSVTRMPNILTFLHLVLDTVDGKLRSFLLMPHIYEENIVLGWMVVGEYE